MRQPFRIAAVTAAAIAFLLAAGSPGQAAVIPGWYSSTDLSLVFNAGNSETYNAAVTTNLTRQWLRTSWKTTGSFVRSDVREPTRRAVGATVATATLEKGPRVTKSEKIFLNSLFERRITERFFWNVGGSGERDVFAGLESRLTGVLAVGYNWQKTDNTANFRASIGGTYTAQEEVVNDPETEDQFAGVRFTASGQKRFGDRNTHAWDSELIVDENVQQTEDLRANWNNSLSVSISQKLALKVGVQLKFDNQPELVEFPLFTRGANGLLTETDLVLAGRAEKTDVTATVSLVINIQPGGGSSALAP